MQLQNLRTCWSRQQVEMDTKPKGASTTTYLKPVMSGGFSDTTDVTEYTQELCNKVKKEVEAKTNQKYAEFKAVKQRRQIVGGTIYLVKIHVKDSHYIHVKIFEALACNGGKLELCGVQENHKKADPLEPF